MVSEGCDFGTSIPARRRGDWPVALHQFEVFKFLATLLLSI